MALLDEDPKWGSCQGLISAWQDPLYQGAHDKQGCHPVVYTGSPVLRLSIHMTVCRYHLLRSSGFEPDRVTFNTLLKSCMKAGDAQKAQQTFAVMQELHVPVSCACISVETNFPMAQELRVVAGFVTQKHKRAKKTTDCKKYLHCFPWQTHKHAKF